MHDFNERLNFSKGFGLNNEILNHIAASVPCADRWEEAGERDDRNGTDYWLYRKGGLPPLSIDMKNREECPIQKYNSDDACIEIVSQFIRSASGRDTHRVGRKREAWRGTNQKVGWTYDITKRTDWVVYTWPSGQTRRFWVVYFPFLCQASLAKRDEWLARHPLLPTPNKNYVTLNVYPTRKEIGEAMRDITTGTIVRPSMFNAVSSLPGVQGHFEGMLERQ